MLSSTFLRYSAAVGAGAWRACGVVRWIPLMKERGVMGPRVMIECLSKRQLCRAATRPGHRAGRCGHGHGVLQYAAGKEQGRVCGKTGGRHALGVHGDFDRSTRARRLDWGTRSRRGAPSMVQGRSWGRGRGARVARGAAASLARKGRGRKPRPVKFVRVLAVVGTEKEERRTPTLGAAASEATRSHISARAQTSGSGGYYRARREEEERDGG